MLQNQSPQKTSQVRIVLFKQVTGQLINRAAKRKRRRTKKKGGKKAQGEEIVDNELRNAGHDVCGGALYDVESKDLVAYSQGKVIEEDIEDRVRKAETTASKTLQISKAIGPPTTDAPVTDAVAKLDIKTIGVESAKDQPEAVEEESVHIDAEEDQVATDGDLQKDKPTESPHTQEEIVGTAENKVGRGVDMSTESSERDFTDTKGDKDVTVEKISTKDSGHWEEAPKPVAEEEWTAVEKWKKKQKKPSPAPLQTTSQVVVPHTSLTKTPSPSKGSGESARHSPRASQTAGSTFHKPSPKLNVSAQPQFVNKDWDIKKTSCWGHQTDTVLNNRAHDDTLHITAKSLPLSILVQNEPTPPPTDSGSEAPGFSPVLEQSESPVASTLEPSTPGDILEGEELQTVVATFVDVEETDEDSESEEHPSTPTNRFSRSAPSTLRNERRRTPRPISPYFRRQPAIAGHGHSSAESLILMQILIDNSSKATQNDEDDEEPDNLAIIPTKSKQVRAEALKDVEESVDASIEVDEFVQVQSEESSAVTLPEVDEATLAEKDKPTVLQTKIDEATLVPYRESVIKLPELNEAAPAESEEPAGIQTKVDEATSILCEESAVSSAEIDEAAPIQIKVLSKVEAEAEESLSKVLATEIHAAVQVPNQPPSQNPKTADAFQPHAPKYKSKFDQPWRKLPNNALVSSNTPSNSSTSKNWRVFGRHGPAEQKTEIPVLTTKPIETKAAWKQEETKVAWAPKNGKLWSEEDEDDEGYKAAYPALG
jgi:hypothetical protein